MSNDEKDDGVVVDDKRDINSFINVNKQTNDTLNDFVKESRQDRKKNSNDSAKDSARYNRDALRDYFERTSRDDDETISRKKMHNQLHDINVALDDLLKLEREKKEDKPFDFMSILPLLTAALVTATSIAKPDDAKPVQTVVKSTMGLAGIGADAIKAANAAKALSASTGILGTLGKTLGKFSDSPMMKNLVRFSSGGMAVGRAMEGDYVGATGEVASLGMHEAAAKVKNPKAKVALTAASLGMDAGMIIRDMFRSNDQKENEKRKELGQEEIDTNTLTKNIESTSMLVLPSLAALAVPLLMSKKFAIPNVMGGESTNNPDVPSKNKNPKPTVKDTVLPQDAIVKAEKGAGQIGAKTAVKGVAKVGAKALPFVGAALGAYGAATRTMDGDYTGAALEAVSGLASFIPVVGTAASLAIQGGLMYRDAVKANSEETATINTISKDGVVSLNNAGVKNAEQSMIASDMVKETATIQAENSNKMTNDMASASSSYLDMTKTMSLGLIGFTTNLGIKFSEWVFGADNIFKKAALTLSSLSSDLMTRLKNGLFGGGGGSTTTKNASAPVADAHAKGSELHSSRKSNMVAVYDSFLKAGMSEAQAKAMTAEIGRENDFGNNLWKTHIDDKNGKKNVGMMSWQNGRDTKLLDYLGKEGVLNKDGTIQRTKEALDAQARFVMKELKGDYKRVGNKFLGEKDISYKDASKMLGKEYIGWAYDNEKYAGGHKRRDDHFANLNTELHKRGIKTPEKKVNYISKKDYDKITKAEPKPPMMASAELHDKWNKKEAERVKQYTKTQSGILDGSIKVGDAPKQSKSNTTVPYAAKSNDAKSSSSTSAPPATPTKSAAASKASYDLDKICNHAVKNASSKSLGKCAEYLRKAIQAGDNTKKVGSLGHARDWGQSLSKIGWVSASGGLQKGDIAWFPKGVSGYGHVCIWTGSVWVSDFIQKSVQPNSKGSLSYQTFRAKSGYTNGTPVGSIAGGTTIDESADDENKVSEGGEGTEELSAVDRVQNALTTGVAAIGAALFDNQMARDAINFFDSAKVDSYDKLDHAKDAVNMNGFDTELKAQDDKGFKYKFGQNGINRSDLFSREIQRQKDSPIDYLEQSGSLNGIQRQKDSPIDYLEQAGSLNGIQRQKDSPVDYLDLAGNLGGIIRQEDKGIDHLGMAGSLDGIQRQGDKKKKRKWYDKLFGGEHSDLFGNLFGAFGLGGIFDFGKGLYGAKQNDDVVGFGLNQIDGAIDKSGGLGNIGDIFKLGKEGYEANEKDDLIGFGLRKLTGLMLGQDVVHPKNDANTISNVPDLSQSKNLSNPVFTNTGALNNIVTNTTDFTKFINGDGLVASNSEDVGSMRQQTSLDNFDLGTGIFGRVQTGKVGMDALDGMMNQSSLGGLYKLGKGAYEADKNDDWLGFGLNAVTDILSGNINLNPFSKKNKTEYVKTEAELKEDALVNELIKPTFDQPFIDLKPEPTSGVLGDPLADMQRDIARNGGGLGAMLSAKNDRDLLAKNKGIIESIPSVDLKPSLAASVLSPDYEGRSKIDGVISETNKTYNDIKNAPPITQSSDTVNPMNQGSGTTPNGSRSGVGEGLSSALVTRNPDSIFREVSITIMKATIT